MYSRLSARRMALTLFAVFAIVGVFVVKLVDIQVVRAGELTAAAEARRSMSLTVWGSRGEIVDANGTVLADSVDRFDITASPKNVGDTTEMTIDEERVEVPTTEAIAKIAELTGTPAADLYAALTEDPESDFTYLVQAVTLETFTAVFDLDIGWVYSELRPARTYPRGAIAGNLVGFLGFDSAPLAGTEYRENECLAATAGTSTFERSADGVRLPGSLVVEQEPIDGGTVHLTIDADLQWYAQQRLAEQATAVGADWGTAMVVRVATGEIVVAADWPSIDPNDLNSVSAENSGARSFTAPFEPGSIMKPVAFATLLDKGLITPETPVTVPGNYTNGLPAGENITDVFSHGDLRWTATGILMNSSNIGTVMLSERLNPQEKYDAFRAFGFGEPTEAGFLGEDGGTVYTPEQTQSDTVTLATQMFGQGITATSAQMASLYQTLGNGGVRMPLTLVAGCEHADGTWTDVPVPTGERVVSEYAADTTLLMMETVASQGASRDVVSVPGYRIAAKTGTGEVAENGRYGSERIVSYAGVFPADNPEYAIVVTLGKPDTMKSSAAAAPVFNAIMEQVIKTFRITPSTEAAPNLPLVW
ncbi:peptidoglycan D,D-transpeptidase FtsI family protein [Pseudolysinimonas yzui]|uniref:Cell division protein FtsI n=1 Tax=Pseudolysinimonas yzui TaxID=2708254 RepID=A0A8J3M334_9MICO|nr:penicillin-binding protein 2 [Pseudolysinimonas yzui]GHF10169.1 cell division protein FtsI [Pseudolysinimonas yzui]